jgi:hypothetical protein
MGMREQATMDKHYVISISTEINRRMFEGDMDAALVLIGEYMRAAGLTVSIQALSSIPIRDGSLKSSALLP